MRPSPRRRILLAVGWVTLLVGLLIVLVAVDDRGVSSPASILPHDISAWIDTTDPAAIAIGIVRLIAITLDVYLLATSLLSMIASLVRGERMLRWTESISLPAVTRLARHVVGASIVSALAMPAPAIANDFGVDSTTAELPTLRHLLPSDPGPIHTLDSTPRPSVSHSDADDPRHRIASEGSHDAGSAPSRVGPANTSTSLDLTDPDAQSPSGTIDLDKNTRVHHVAPGENLWIIAHDEMRSQLGREPSEDELVDYWQILISHNQQRLVQPDNPDLVYPGQAIEVPNARVNSTENLRE